MKLEEFLKSNNIPFKKNVPLSEITGMNLNGRLDYVTKPSSTEQLKKLYQFIVINSLSFEIVGGLTNTYLCEGFCRDIIIQTNNIHEINWKGNEVEVSCGYNLNKLALEVSRLGGAGFEGFVGIPGTVGAAAINNSGAFGSEMSNVLKRATILKLTGEEVILTNADFGYGVRHSKLKNTSFGLLQTVTLDISQKGEKDEIEKQIAKVREIRKKRREWDRKSLGSIFVGKSISNIWKMHPNRNIIRKLLYAPFKYTNFRRRAQCFSEFVALGSIRHIRHCDNIGRFCWDNDTKEKDFLDYIDFVKRVSNQKAILEIDIKR